jgi:hypothetical protein
MRPGGPHWIFLGWLQPLPTSFAYKNHFARISFYKPCITRFMLLSCSRYNRGDEKRDRCGFATSSSRLTRQCDHRRKPGLSRPRQCSTLEIADDFLNWTLDGKHTVIRFKNGSTIDLKRQGRPARRAWGDFLGDFLLSRARPAARCAIRRRTRRRGWRAFCARP